MLEKDRVKKESIEKGAKASDRMDKRTWSSSYLYTRTDIFHRFPFDGAISYLTTYLPTNLPTGAGFFAHFPWLNT